MKDLDRNDPCPSCGRFANRGISIDAVIIMDGKVLLIKRGVDPHRGYWGTPGGYVSQDESAENTVKREVKEETNLDVQSVKLIGVNSSPERHPKQVINLVYKVKVKEGVIEVGDDAQEYKWFLLDRLPKKIALDYRQYIQDVIDFNNRK